MSNYLKVNLQATVRSLYEQGWSCRRIARELGINRRTAQRYAAAGSELAAEAKASNGTEEPERAKCTISIAGSEGVESAKCTIATPWVGSVRRGKVHHFDPRLRGDRRGPAKQMRRL